MSSINNLEKYKLNKIPFFVLAPMDDVTDTVFRQVIADIAQPDLYFTEFVNVDGLQSPGREKLLPRLKLSSKKEHPIVAQVWGKDPENYYKTVLDIKEMGYDGVDINMGCPDKAVVKNGCCSALINDRKLAGDIIDAVKDAAGPTFPTSVKCRVGFTTVDLSWIEFLLLKILNMLSIHLRTTKDMSKVPARWELMEEIVAMKNKISPTTLLVGNGDVLSRKQGEELANKYNLDGIMIGRGIFHNPYIFSEESAWESTNKQTKIDLYKKHVQLFADTWQQNERHVQTLNKFCKVYIQNFPGAKELREKLMSCKTTEKLLQVLS
ncbi:tRNA-dihydrouridine synthase [Candidatus Saccharibacteria bacterium]|nr:tRNA-dihydrouridine synthase [Candidatus Saccharibacteria bacterium]